MATSTATLLVPGLKPVDPAFESWWVRPGRRDRGRAARRRPRHGRRPRRRAAGRADRARRPTGARTRARSGARADAPATRAARQRRRRRSWPRCTRAGCGPHDARRCGCSAPTRRPARSQAFLAERDALVVVAAPGGPRSSTATRRPRSCVVEMRRADAAAGRPRSSCRRRWPSRGWTSASTAPPRWPTRCARASTSRSSTSRAASARTSSPSTRASSSAASSAGSTARPRAR